MASLQGLVGGAPANNTLFNERPEVVQLAIGAPDEFVMKQTAELLSERVTLGEGVMFNPTRAGADDQLSSVRTRTGVTTVH